MAGIRSTTAAFVLLSLLCLVYAQSAQDVKDSLIMLVRNFEYSLREIIISKTEDKEIHQTISKLLDSARSLTDENDLEIFKDYLQEAVDQANREKAEDKERIEEMSNQFNDQVIKRYPSLQLLKMKAVNSQTQEIVKRAERVLIKIKIYMDLKKQVLSGTEEYNEKKLLKILNVVNTQQDVHFEL